MDDIAILQQAAQSEEYRTAGSGQSEERPADASGSEVPGRLGESSNGQPGEMNERSAETSERVGRSSGQSQSAIGESRNSVEESSNGRLEIGGGGAETAAAVASADRAPLERASESSKSEASLAETAAVNVSTSAEGEGKTEKHSGGRTELQLERERETELSPEQSRAAGSEEASTSGMEEATHLDRRIALMSPQDFHVHLMQVSGRLLKHVQVVEGWEFVWRIDKDGNRSSLPRGTHSVAEDDVIELLLTHSQLVDLAEAVDAFLKDKATWPTGDRPMLVKVPPRPEETPVKAEKVGVHLRFVLVVPHEVLACFEQVHVTVGGLKLGQ